MLAAHNSKATGRLLRLFAWLMIALPLLAESSDAFAQACINGRAGRQMIEKREIAPFPDAARRAGVRERLAGVELCPQGSGFVYRLRIPRRQGGERRMEIPAR